MAAKTETHATELRPSGHELIQYFRTKRRQLATMADLPICSHNGLAGSHREELERIYLREILPKRFEVGRGMVYGQFHRSREADIVIWDAQNYPSLPMLDHSFYFAESVKVVLESKTTYSSKEMRDVMSKARSVRDIVLPAASNLDDLLETMLLDIRSLKSGTTHGGLLISRPHIGTSAIFLTGGGLGSIYRQAQKCHDIDDSWPDLVLLLEPGIVARKLYSAEGRGALLFYKAGIDCLLSFTSLFLELLRNRIVSVESPHYLLSYAMDFELDPAHVVDFRLTRFPVGRMPLAP